MQNYTDSCDRESEKRAAYPEKITSYFENITSINDNRDSVILQERENGSKKFHHDSPYEKSVANQSIEEIIRRKKIIRNASETIEQNKTKKIKLYLYNMIQETNLLTTLPGGIIPRHLMEGTQQLVQVLLST